MNKTTTRTAEDELLPKSLALRPTIARWAALERHFAEHDEFFAEARRLQTDYDDAFLAFLYSDLDWTLQLPTEELEEAFRASYASEADDWATVQLEIAIQYITERTRGDGIKFLMALHLMSDPEFRTFVTERIRIAVGPEGEYFVFVRRGAQPRYE